MRILFLHIGDIHIKDDRAINEEQLDKVADTLNMYHFDEIIVIIAGDIAFSGKLEQYEVATKFIELLYKKITNRKPYIDKINYICVPGNHDMDHHGRSLTSTELHYIREEEGYEVFLDDEIQKMYDFYTFSRKFDCFNKRNVYERQMLKLNNFLIEVNMINSAIFSSLEEDKGFHFISQDDIDGLRKPSGADFVITVMHHPTEWYNDKCKFDLDIGIKDKSSIIFYGHQHRALDETISVEDNPKVLIELGGCLCNNEDWSDSSFNILLFDSDTFECDRRKLQWDSDSLIYDQATHKREPLAYKPSIEKIVNISKLFYSYLLIDEKHQINMDFRNYYIFPRLQSELGANNDKREFTTLSSFIEEVYQNKIIVISGEYNSGKTTLLKFIFLYLYNNGFYPLICKGENIKGNLDRIIRNSFENVYGDNTHDFIKFEQISKSKKAILIDDFDNIHEKSQNMFLNLLKEKFEIIILASKRQFDLNILDRMKRELDTEYSKFWYTLMPFYLDKRRELIEKVVPLIVSVDKDVPKIIYQLNDTITKQRRFIRLDPDFIISYIEYYCNNLSTHITGGSGIFSKVFEANLINSISKYASEKLSTDKIILILSKIAYHIHFNKLYPISDNEIFRVIESYNNQYGTKVSIKNFIDIVTNAKIMIEINKENTYYFSNQTYLAYFVASEINRQFINTSDTSQLNYILKLACFGINADIILFISLITDNIKILRLILSMINEYTSKWEEFDFITNIPKYLQQEFTYHVEEPPADIKKCEEEERTRIEKESSFEIKKNNIYDYDENDSDSIMNQIIRALQLLYIVSRCLPSFEHAMLKSDKDDFVDTIYKLPNKIFNLWISDTQNKIDDIMSFFKDKSHDYYLRKKYPTESEIIQVLQLTSMAFLLELYGLTSYYSVKENTISYLSNFTFTKKLTYELEYLFILLRNSSSKFTQKAIELKEKNIKNNHYLYQFLVSKIVEYAFVFSYDLDFDKRQQLKSKFFPTFDQKSKSTLKKMEMERLKNTNVNK